MTGASDDPITEGYFDRHVHRPLATWLLGQASRPPSTQQLTFAAGVVGLTGAIAVLLATPHSLGWIFPAWLLFAFTIAARARRLTATVPPDHTLEFAVGVAFWIALTVRAAPTTSWACTSAALALGSAFVHAGLYAQIRARFLDFTAEPTTSPSTSSLGAAVSHDLAALLLGPEHRGARPPRGAARSLLAGPMRMAGILSPDTHLALLYVATAVAAIRLDLSFWAVIVAVAVGLNLWALLVTSAWRRAEVLVRRIAPV